MACHKLERESRNVYTRTADGNNKPDPYKNTLLTPFKNLPLWIHHVIVCVNLAVTLQPFNSKLYPFFR